MSDQTDNAADTGAAVASANLREPLALQAIDGGRMRSVIMWMPAGRHRIRATRAGAGPIEADINVTPETAQAMQAALLREEATGHRPLIDFDHQHGAAAGWPLRYWWEDGKGVMVDVEWSEAGAAAIRGRSYRAFSPEFYPDNNGRVTGAPKFHGSLVNDPAFKAIEPLWAADADTFPITAAPAARQSNQEHHMDKEEKQTGSGNAAAADEQAKLAVQAAGQKEAALQAKLADAEERLAAMRKEKAQAAVQAAVERGALPPLDKAIQAKWADLVEQDESHLELLAALPGKTALQSAAAPGAGIAVQARPGIAEALKSFQAAGADQRASIYSKEVAPFLDKGERLGPILAANSLDTLSGELVTQRALSLLKLSFPILSKVSTDFSAGHAAFNQTVNTRIRSVPSVTNYNTSTGYATSDAETTDVPVTIDNHKAVQISYNANELASTERDLFGEQAEGCQYALGKAMVDELYALITAGNYTNATTKALSTFSRAEVTAMAKALFDRGVPAMGRFLLLNSAYFEKLQSDASIVSLAAYQRPEVITQYTLPPIAGFDVLQAVNLPTTANLTGFAGAPDALAIATRLPNDYSAALPGATGGGVVSTVRNPDTGISVMLVQHVNHTLGAAYWRIALMFGVAKGQVASGQRLISA
jgi:phage I-like protein